MFNIKDYVKSNLIKGYEKGSFSREQVAIFSTNYMIKGILDLTDIEEIDNACLEIDKAKIVAESPQIDTSDEVVEEVTEETETEPNEANTEE